MVEACPEIIILPVAYNSPPIYTLPAIPAPPDTCKAPEVVENDGYVLTTYTLLAYKLPAIPTPPVIVHAPVTLDTEICVHDVERGILKIVTFDCTKPVKSITSPADVDVVR